MSLKVNTVVNFFKIKNNCNKCIKCKVLINNLLNKLNKASQLMYFKRLNKEEIKDNSKLIQIKQKGSILK